MKQVLCCRHWCPCVRVAVLGGMADRLAGPFWVHIDARKGRSPGWNGRNSSKLTQSFCVVSCITSVCLVQPREGLRGYDTQFELRHPLYHYI